MIFLLPDILRGEASGRGAAPPSPLKRKDLTHGIL